MFVHGVLSTSPMKETQCEWSLGLFKRRKRVSVPRPGCSYLRGRLLSSWGSCWSVGWWRPCPAGMWWPPAEAAAWPAHKTPRSLSLSASSLRSCIFPSFLEVSAKWLLQKSSPSLRLEPSPGEACNMHPVYVMKRWKVSPKYPQRPDYSKTFKWVRECRTLWCGHTLIQSATQGTDTSPAKCHA